MVRIVMNLLKPYAKPAKMTKKLIVSPDELVDVFSITLQEH